MRLASILLLLSPACAVQRDTGTASFDGAVDSVAVDLFTGDVTILGAADATESSVRWETRWTGARPDVEVELSGGVLFVDDLCPTNGMCEIDLTIRVPASAGADLALGTGDLVVEGLAGAVTADLGSADVRLDDVSGPVRVTVGTGDVSGEGLAGSLSADVENGDVDVAHVASADADVTVGTGDVTLEVPEGAYRTSLVTDVGEVSLEGVEESGSATTLLSADVGTGDIRVIGR